MMIPDKQFQMVAIKVREEFSKLLASGAREISIYAKNEGEENSDMYGLHFKYKDVKNVLDTSLLGITASNSPEFINELGTALAKEIGTVFCTDIVCDEPINLDNLNYLDNEEAPIIKKKQMTPQEDELYDDYDEEYENDENDEENDEENVAEEEHVTVVVNGVSITGFANEVADIIRLMKK